MVQKGRIGFVFVCIGVICFFLAVYIYPSLELYPHTVLTIPVISNASDIAKIRYENRRLRAMLKSTKDVRPQPLVQSERIRRKIEQEVRDLGHFVQSQTADAMDSLVKSGDGIHKGTVDKLNQTIGSVKSYIKTAMADFQDMGNLYREWKDEKSINLTKTVQAKIYQIMNPENCQEKKKIFCNFDTFCGFGCQIHHLLYCLDTAIYYDRPLVLNSEGWEYSRHGWETAFKPISDTCQNAVYNGRQDVRLPVVAYWNQPNRDHFPLAFPEELSADLERIHGNPAVWWIGQLAAYLFRYQPILTKYISDVKDRIGFKTPIVGVHVRRTDKLVQEAASYSIEKYMDYVDEFYSELEEREKVDKRRVFLATDEPEVVQRARKIYPQYEIINDQRILESAGTEKRYAFSSLLGIVADIHLLAESDFLVCTFSSNVGRLGFELMQAMHVDSSRSARSLDSLYYFHGQNQKFVKVLQRHVPHSPDELALNPGDQVAIFPGEDTSHIYLKKNGYSKGRHNTTGKVGIFPSYKVEEIGQSVNFPVEFQNT